MHSELLISTYTDSAGELMRAPTLEENTLTFQRKRRRLCQPTRAKRRGSSQGFFSEEEASQMAAQPWPEWPNPPNVTGVPVDDGGVPEELNKQDKETMMK